jgi:hypothetical protein
MTEGGVKGAASKRLTGLIIGVKNYIEVTKNKP